MTSQRNKRFCKLIVSSITLLIISFLTSCGTTPIPTKNPIEAKVIKLTNSPEKKTTHAGSNTKKSPEQSAITYTAKYGVTYEILGNVIAQYPNFDLSIFSKNTIPDSEEYVTIYELTSKDGFAKTHITIDPREKDKQHFYLESLHFYFHSDAANQINIYMPPQLLAGR